jgi:hypothetical protein
VGAAIRICICAKRAQSDSDGGYTLANEKSKRRFRSKGVMIKRILRKYKYPPDDPKTGEYTVSVSNVLDQAELLARFWAKGK